MTKATVIIGSMYYEVLHSQHSILEELKLLYLM